LKSEYNVNREEKTLKAAVFKENLDANLAGLTTSDGLIQITDVDEVEGDVRKFGV
jgi:hypothetical protein